MNTRVKRRITTGVAVLALATAGGAGIAAANGSLGSGLDDGKSLASQARITQQQAEQAAQSATPGALNETDLEDYKGDLVYNVDVGSKDVKVDASTGKVLAVTADD